MNEAKCNVYGSLVDSQQIIDKREFQTAGRKFSHVTHTCFTVFCYSAIKVWFVGAKQFSTNEISVEVTYTGQNTIGQGHDNSEKIDFFCIEKKFDKFNW